MLLMIDNYDSFTYNIARYFRELGVEVRVVKNDEYDIDELSKLRPSHVVISPGPGRPESSGVSFEAIRYFAGRVPLLGVCLGHQCIATCFGGRVTHAGQVMHGKTSSIYHRSKGLFNEIPQGFHATRYHSLVVDRASLPQNFTVDAWVSDENTSGEHDEPGEIMALSHASMPVFGVQFHPESVMSESGHQLLQNFLSV